MTYKAVVGKIFCSPHPNADKIKIGHIHGFQVIVDLSVTDGELYVFFDCEGKLSEEFCKEHDLIRRKDSDGKHAGGFFEPTRRVRAQPFRGVRSEGYAVPLSWFEFTGYDVTSLKEGDQFDSLNGVPICEKYFTKATLARIAANGTQKENPLKKAFPQHYDTAQFRYALLEKGDLITITEKEHGTSVRYGYVEVPAKTPWHLKIIGWILKSPPKSVFERHILGTRRAILEKKDSEFSFRGGYYGDGEPYNLAAKKLYGKLKLGEIVYGELVGYTSNGRALFTHSLDKLPELEKQYGSPIDYSYGCIQGEARFRAYRITHSGRDLDQFELQQRCEELEIERVTEIDMFVYDGNRDKLNAYIETLLEGASLVDHKHIREGVCISVRNKFGIRVYKEKSYSFKLAEGIIKEDENYVDMEEIA